MFYETDKNNHGLPYNPFKSIVVPRPIGWITTLDPAGVINLAPFSQFNNLGYDPPYVMFAASNKPGGQPKDSVVNAMHAGEFVCSMATYDLREAVNTTAQFVDSDVDEMALAGLTPAPSRMVAPPRVAESPVHLECRFYGSMVLPGHTIDNTSHVVVGRVVGVHIDDDALARTAGSTSPGSSRSPGSAISTTPRWRRCSRWRWAGPMRTASAAA